MPKGTAQNTNFLRNGSLNEIDLFVELNMKENVVFIFGAGFSAPLGLPVVSNFYGKSKDLSETDPNTYQFQSIFDECDKLDKINRYYKTNAFDIEEMLSILFMQSALSENKEFDHFSKYVCDVVNGYTPKFSQPTQKFNSNFKINGIMNWLFNLPNTIHNSYLTLAANLLGLSFSIKDSGAVVGGAREELCYSHSESDFRYDAITMNYDMVVENACEWFKSLSTGNFNDLTLKKSWGQSSPNTGGHYAKLHGSVSDGKIVPPTWNKNIEPHIKDAWVLASNLLARAHHIRILGYSLPENDNYFKYLLKYSALRSHNLKTIHVLCKDQDKIVEDRYRKFIPSFQGFKFLNVSMENYLPIGMQSLINHTEDASMRAEHWEYRHRVFVDQQS
jgi:hypothetical protein